MGRPAPRYWDRKGSELDAGLGRKEEAISEARRAVELRPIAKDSCSALTWSVPWRLSTPGPVNGRLRLSNWKSSRNSGLALPTANSASIRRGILCAAIRASRKSSPRRAERGGQIRRRDHATDGSPGEPETLLQRIKEQCCRESQRQISGAGGRTDCDKE